MISPCRPLLMIPALLVVAIVAVAAYKFQPVINPAVIATADAPADCDLHRGPCTVRFADGQRVTLSIRPRPVKVMAPLDLEVRTTLESPWSVEVDFTGIDMNMGYNRPALRRVDTGHFSGQTMLPTCIRERMAWEATVLIRTPVGYHAAPFPLTTVRSLERDLSFLRERAVHLTGRRLADRAAKSETVHWC